LCLFAIDAQAEAKAKKSLLSQDYQESGGISVGVGVIITNHGLISVGFRFAKRGGLQFS